MIEGRVTVPASLIAPIIAKEAEFRTAEDIARSARVSEKVVNPLIAGELQEIRADHADRLLAAVDATDAWFGSKLREHYEAIDWGAIDRMTAPLPTNAPAPIEITETTRRCARPGCNNLFGFEPHTPRRGRRGKRYCSAYCRERHWRERKQPRKSPTVTINGEDLRRQLIMRCKNGHERTPENTKIRADGSRVCRVCLREADRRRRQKSAA